MEAAMQDITKLCADSLRAVVNNHPGNKLGSAHAHELVAAYFGYRSRSALLADDEYSLEKLKQAEFIVMPSLDILNWRIKSLVENLAIFPDSVLIAKCIHSALVTEKWILEKTFSSFEELATHAAKGVLQRGWNSLGINSETIESIILGMDIDVKVESKEDGIEAVVLFSYMTSGSAPERLRERKVSVSATRIAANLGFGELKTFETQYSAGARKMSFPDDIVWPVHRN
jgi:hypothetical protein